MGRGNTIVEVATGVAHPPGGQWHSRPILQDYTRVEVHTVKPNFMTWEIEHPTPEGLVHLGEVTKQFILWHKKDIVLNVSSPTPSDVHLERAVEDREVYSSARGDHMPEVAHSSLTPRDHMPDEPQTSPARRTEQGHDETMPQHSPTHHIEHGHDVMP
jgi:hypothetical protein